eukprot:Lankesteria_metandrocarpae@DN5112_c0_g1_i3.p1
MRKANTNLNPSSTKIQSKHCGRLLPKIKVKVINTPNHTRAYSDDDRHDKENDDRSAPSTEQPLVATVLDAQCALPSLISRRNELQSQVEKVKQAIETVKSTVPQVAQKKCQLEVDVQEKLQLLHRSQLMHEDRVMLFTMSLAEKEVQLNQLRQAAVQYRTNATKMAVSTQDTSVKVESQRELLHTLEKKKLGECWLSMSLLSLTKQKHDAIKEIDGHLRRLDQYRSLLEVSDRRLYNCLQDLKGNIRVFARIRPLLDHERGVAGGGEVDYFIKDDTSLTIRTERQNVTGTSDLKEDYTFILDRTFDSSAAQAQIFDEISQLVQSAVNGCHVCIFAYGQTGSGKTHTMEGPEDCIIEADHGMIPRAVNMIFSSIKSLHQNQWVITVHIAVLEVRDGKRTASRWTRAYDGAPSRYIPFACSAQCTLHFAHCTLHTLLFILHTLRFTLHTILFTLHTLLFTLHTILFTLHTLLFTLHTVLFTLHTGVFTLRTVQIYNECIRDLLNADAGEVKLETKNGRVFPQCKHVLASDSQSVHRILSQASKLRASASTALNPRSSRSHCVFQMRLMGEHRPTNQSFKSVLSMVDLAGSERVGSSGAAGDRLREAQHINKSLSCLGDVIASIASRSAHTPFRNSKLTLLLKDCFSGQGKTMMLVNLSPLKVHANETLNTLRFAAKVNACVVGKSER